MLHDQNNKIELHYRNRVLAVAEARDDRKLACAQRDEVGHGIEQQRENNKFRQKETRCWTEDRWQEQWTKRIRIP